MPPVADQRPEQGVEAAETGNGKFQVEIRWAGGAFLADEPQAAGGLGSGPNPYDLLCAALGACTTMTVRLYADRKGWPLKRASVRVVHRSDGLTAKDQFAREIVLEGELDAGQRTRLREIAERCPVHLTLERSSDIVTVLTETPLAGGLDPEPLEHAIEMVEACED